VGGAKRDRGVPRPERKSGEFYFGQGFFVSQIHPWPGTLVEPFGDSNEHLLEWRPPLATEVAQYSGVHSVLALRLRKRLSSKRFDVVDSLSRGLWPAERPLPDFVLETLRGVVDELWSTATRAIHALRWRGGAFVELPMVLGTPGPVLSRDGSTWIRVPDRRAVMWAPEQTTGLDLGDPIRSAVLAAVRNTEREPVAHEILHEARVLLHSSPRSALLLAVAAAEVGFKILADTLSPGAPPLLEDRNAPPLSDLLTMTLPTLPIRSSLNSAPASCPPRILSRMVVAIERRNAIAHKGAEAPRRESMESIFASIRDLLWLYDVYAGHRWAALYLSNETRQEFGLESVEQPKRTLRPIYVQRPPPADGTP
jgi:hypothetical protein